MKEGRIRGMTGNRQGFFVLPYEFHDEIVLRSGSLSQMDLAGDLKCHMFPVAIETG